MKEINIGRVLIKNRHKRGITQDELATHLGVSKGAVSKWETGSSLPDILLLPQLVVCILKPYAKIKPLFHPFCMSNDILQGFH